MTELNKSEDNSSEMRYPYYNRDDADRRTDDRRVEHLLPDKEDSIDKRVATSDRRIRDDRRKKAPRVFSTGSPPIDKFKENSLYMLTRKGIAYG